MSWRRSSWIASLAIFAGASLAAASIHFSNGPEPSHTGASMHGAVAGEPSCTACHQTYDLDGNRLPNFNLPGGGVDILDMPPYWTPGRTYTLRVRLWSDSTVVFASRRWGFQITAFDATTGEGVGAFSTRTPDSLQVIPGTQAPWTSRTYVEHRLADIHQGESGPVEWSFDWTAPPDSMGQLAFAVAGNAANGNGDPSGDFIYTREIAVADTTTPARMASWGALKKRWR
jgi:hypothetical protein